MKRLISFCFMVLCVMTLFAQKDVTTFLGIPVDGTKAEMRQKLIAKGFSPSKFGTEECFSGEFNGEDVLIFIQTMNNKVYRLYLKDKNERNEFNIKQRYNMLVQQFQNNSRYVYGSDQSLSDSEDISYEMIVHNKQYQAIFFQKPNGETSPSDAMSLLANKVVWFTIMKSYSDYYIVMYYENLYNQANGEDL